MATELGQAYVQIMPSAKGISGSIQKTLDPEALAAGKSAGSNIANSIASSLGNIGSSLSKKITLPATAAATAVGGIVAALGWKRLTGLDAAQAQLKGLGYAIADVERISKQVSNSVQGTVMTMAEGTSVAAGALAAGVSEGVELEQYIRRVGNAAVGSGREVGDMAQIFNRVQGSGKLMTQELNMIEDGMPGFAMAMSESLGVTQEEFRKMVTEGKVSSEQFMTVMDSFAGEMSEAYANSWAGMVDNTKANIGIIGQSILGGVFEQSKESIAEFLEYLRSDDVKAWAAEVGVSIGNAFSAIIETVKSAIEWWTGLDDSTKKVILTMAGIAIAIGPVLAIVSKMIAVVTAASQIFAALKVAAGVLGVAIGAITAPVAIAIAAIAAIIAIGVLLYKNWDEIKSKATQLASWIKSIWDGIKKSISDAWNSIKTTTSNVWNGIKATITNLLNSIKSTFSNIFNSLKTIVSNAFSAVKDAVSTGMTNAYNAVTGFFQKFKDAGKKIVTSIADGIRAAIGEVKDAISSVVQTVRDYLPFSPAKEGPLKDLHRLDFSIIADGIHNAKNPIEKAMSELAQSTLDSYGAITDISSNITHRVTGSTAQNGASLGGDVTVVQHIYSPTPDPRTEQRRAAREFKKLALGV